MTKITIAFSTTAPFSKVRLNDDELFFDATGTATPSVQEGVKNILSWMVRGAPSDTYTIAVIDPAEISTKHTEDLGGDVIGYGTYSFTVHL